MTGIIIYFCIVQYAIYLFTFGHLLIKGYIYNNYFAMIPFIGSKSAFIWLVLSYKVEKKDKKIVEAEKIEKKSDEHTIKMQIIFNRLFDIYEINRRFGRYNSTYSWDFSDYIRNFDRLNDCAINADLFNSVNKCVQLFKENKSTKVVELFFNMVDTLYGIFNVDGDTRISDEVLMEITELCNNYYDVISSVITKEKTEAEENSKRKSEKYNGYVKGRIKSINSILKDVKKDLKVS